MSRLSIWVAALWWSSLGVVCYLVVPMLFANLPTPALAGGMAAKLFTAQTWLSTICGLLLLIIYGLKQPLEQAERAQAAIILVVLGMLLALLCEFVVAPRIVARENLGFWHSVGSAMFVLQWLCAGMTLWKLTSRY